MAGLVPAELSRSGVFTDEREPLLGDDVLAHRNVTGRMRQGDAYPCTVGCWAEAVAIGEEAVAVDSSNQNTEP